MRQRNKYFQLRLTEKELNAIKTNSASYSSASHYIRSAIAEYSNINSKERLDMIIRLSQFYDKWSVELGHMGGNLNQTVKRANELAIAGLLTEEYIDKLAARVKDIQVTLNDIKRELYAVTRKDART